MCPLQPQRALSTQAILQVLPASAPSRNPPRNVACLPTLLHITAPQASHPHGHTGDTPPRTGKGHTLRTTFPTRTNPEKPVYVIPAGGSPHSIHPDRKSVV